MLAVCYGCPGQEPDKQFLGHFFCSSTKNHWSGPDADDRHDCSAEQKADVRRQPAEREAVRTKGALVGSSFLMLGHCKFGVPVPVERLAIGVSIVVGADHVRKSNIDQNATRERLRCG